MAQCKQKKLEMMFTKHYAPNPLLVKDGTLLQHMDHLKFEASSYTPHQPLSADLYELKKKITKSSADKSLKLLAINVSRYLN